MKIEKNTVINFTYVLSNADGDELERGDADNPSAYLHGYGNILYGLETAMAGKEAGDSFEVTLPPEQCYGLRREDAKQRVPIKHLLSKGKLRPGITVKINSNNGPKDATVLKVGKFNVDVDSNHPLAGLELSFKVDIVEVRDATAEEKAHGHAHGVGGHAH